MSIHLSFLLEDVRPFSIIRKSRVHDNSELKVENGLCAQTPVSGYSNIQVQHRRLQSCLALSAAESLVRRPTGVFPGECALPG